MNLIHTLDLTAISSVLLVGENARPNTTIAIRQSPPQKNTK